MPSAITAPRQSLTENLDGARKTMADLAAVGIVMKDVTDKLTTDGVKLFADVFGTLLAGSRKEYKAEYEAMSTAQINPEVNSQTASLPANLDAALKKN